MTGLLLKDFFMLKRSSLVLLLLMMMCALVPMDTIKAFVATYAGVLVANGMGYDERARWDRTAAAMPYGRGKVVLSRYVFGLCILTLSALLALFSEGMLGPLWVHFPSMATEVYTGFDMGRAAWMMATGLIFQALMLPFMHWLGAEKGRVALTGCFMVAMAGTLLLEKQPEVQRLLAPILSASGGWFLLGAVVLNVVSCGLSTWLYKRRAL